ncbi:MAG TPA: DUF1573 domain-containing protein [Cytophagales bacterium]|nr:DUF1573 domain-containing protein [Cytophagales bacterium]HAA19468.1 DUF1573 domain-containing protein [Cytophagales bacterium]HAP59698.1 DUF1573 domain-containing protein [Cytophagales bacterium]
MKKVILIVGLAVATLTSAFAPEFAAAFQWEETAVNVGKIPQNIPHVVKFTFTNEGNAPLIISRTQGSCGCTASEYSQEAIAPGAEGWVKATYNAAKSGPFNKTVTVFSNVEGNPVVLTLKGEVTTD